MEIEKKMSRREKFKYLKAKGFKVTATMKNVELDKLLDMNDPSEQEIPETKGKARRRRVPLGTHRSKLDASSYDIPANKVPRWVNDTAGRLRDALEGGYEFVQDPNAEGHVGEDPMQSQGMGSAVNVKVGTNEDGSPLRGYLMVIDRELYEEDQADKMAKVDEMDDAIKKGSHQSDYHDGKYIPPGGIRM
jgi:hypothetical protein